MARIDVTELLTDPDFVGPIQQIKRKDLVDNFGVLQLTEVCVNTVGSVQPISGREINRLPESLRVADMMTFYIKGVITASAPGKYSDILVSNGKRYQILSVNDWSAWGAGWCKGACVAEVLS
jgi:galactose-6-phosphate isomerase